jgi:hypothetical protein
MSSDVRAPPPLPRIPRPTSVVVWGLHRPLVTRVAIGLAQAVGPETFWFEIASRDTSTDPQELSELRFVEPKHAFWVEPADVAPDARFSRPERWAILSHPESDPEVPALRNLLEMPPRLRTLLLERDPALPTAAVVLSNTDRAAVYYSAEPGTFRDGIAVMNRLGLTFIATTGRVPRPNARDFALVFEVDPDHGRALGTVVCHAGDPSLGPTFVAGARTPLPVFLEDLRSGPHRSSQGAP